MLRYATPEYVLLAFCALKVYHWVSKKHGKMLFVQRVPCHSFAWMYLFLLYLYIRAAVYTHRSAFPESAMFEPGMVERHVNLTLVRANDTASFDDWLKEASLQGYDCLRWMSVASPYWVGATFVVCLYHIAKHTQMMHRTQWNLRRDDMAFNLHDLTIQVLLLPTIYGLMSLHAVIFMWGIVLNEETSMKRLGAWHLREKYYSEMYENAFFIADIYESFALLVLGNILMAVLKNKVGHHQVAHHQPAFADDDKARSPNGLAVSSGISAQKLMDELTDLTTFGIKFFCWTCGLQALYQLLLTTMGYYGIFEDLFALGDAASKKMPGLLHTEGIENKARYFFLGAGFVASFAAIGNVVKVETSFHHQLEEFQPFWKFWGTKIIVSIAFLQSMALCVLPPFSWWSSTRQRLFYASLLCLECFLVSLMHLKAWGHDQEWYGGAFRPEQREEFEGWEGPSANEETDCSEEDTAESTQPWADVVRPGLARALSAPQAAGRGAGGHPE